MSLSIYIHIPFCASKCAYCAFYSAAADDFTKERYADALVNAIAHAEYDGEKIESVFFGGGTPSVMNPKNFYRILNALDRKFSLSGAEITTELNPDSVDNILAPEIFPFFTRLSMGIQSFDDETLKLLGRRHNAAGALSAYEKIRGAGAKNVNLDLMLALPGDADHKKMTKSLETAIGLNPEHLSAYILTIEAGTPFYEKYAAASDDNMAEAYLKACELLENAGYEHYEISNFAKPGFRCRHNLCYWTQRKYIAFGPQSCGFDGRNRYRFDCTTDEFIRKNGTVKPFIEEALDDAALEKEKIMLSLRLSDGIDAEILEKITQNPVKKKLTDQLIQSGLAKKENGAFCLTDSGFLVSNEIIREIIK